jgi:hypothetical protein
MKYKGLIALFVVNELSVVPMLMIGKTTIGHFFMGAAVFGFICFLFGVLMWVKAKWYHYPELLLFLGLVASTAYYAGKA